MATEEDRVFRVKYAGEPNIKCKGCGTYAEVEDVVFGVATFTMGVQGSYFWRHFDCADMANVRQCFEQSQDLSEVIKGWHSLGEDDQDFVMETFTDISQGLGKENIRKHRLRGRKTRIEVEEPTSKENVAPMVSQEEEGAAADGKPAAASWMDVAKAKQQKEKEKKKAAKAKAEAKAQAKAEAKEKRDAAKREREEKKAARQVKAAQREAKKAEAARKRAQRDGVSEDAYTTAEVAAVEGAESAAIGDGTASAAAAAAPTPAPVVKKRRKNKSTKPSEPKKEKQLKGGPVLPKKANEYFYDDKRESLRSLYPEATLSEVKTMITDAWNALSSDERMPFESMAVRDKSRYTRQLKEFKSEGKFSVLAEDKQASQPSLHSHATGSKGLGFSSIVVPKLSRQGSFGAGFQRSNSFSHNFGRRKSSKKKSGFSPV